MLWSIFKVVLRQMVLFAFSMGFVASSYNDMGRPPNTLFGQSDSLLLSSIYIYIQVVLFFTVVNVGSSWVTWGKIKFEGFFFAEATENFYNLAKLRAKGDPDRQRRMIIFWLIACLGPFVVLIILIMLEVFFGIYV